MAAPQVLEPVVPDPMVWVDEAPLEVVTEMPEEPVLVEVAVVAVDAPPLEVFAPLLEDGPVDERAAAEAPLAPCAEVPVAVVIAAPPMPPTPFDPELVPAGADPLQATASITNGNRARFREDSASNIRGILLALVKPWVGSSRTPRRMPARHARYP